MSKLSYEPPFTFYADTANATVVFNSTGSEAVYTWDIPWTRLTSDFSMNGRSSLYKVEYRFEGKEFCVVQETGTTGATTSADDGSNLFGKEDLQPFYMRSNLTNSNYSTSGYADIIGIARAADLFIGNSFRNAATGLGAWRNIGAKYRCDPSEFKCENLDQVLRIQVIVTASVPLSAGTIAIQPLNGTNLLRFKGVHEFKFYKAIF